MGCTHRIYRSGSDAKLQTRRDRNASAPNGNLMKKAAIFLDRDGVINRYRLDYVKSWDEFEFLPSVLDALRDLASSSRAIVIVSNQSAVSRGLITKEAVDEIHHRMLQRIRRAGGRVDAIYYCPHGPSDDCYCRKPRPGLLLQAAEDLNLHLGSSWFIGDNITDVHAGIAAGVQPVLVRSGKQNRALVEPVLAQIVVLNDLKSFVQYHSWRTERGPARP